MLAKGSGGIWSVTVSGLSGTVYYGYRAWGPNWPYNPAWTKGSTTGWLSGVDSQGHRFNPNKLLLDPYAREISHDPQTPADPGYTDYGTRATDTAPFAPKGIVLAGDSTSTGTKPTRAFKDDIVYEVHLRGLTKNDSSIPAAYRGTYKGAGLKAGYLAALSVTAVEFLPCRRRRTTTTTWTRDPRQTTTVDSSANWLTYPGEDFHTFTQRLIAFRNAHPQLRPATFYAPSQVQWFTPAGVAPDNAYWNNAANHALAWRVQPNLYVAYNGWSDDVTFTLPAPPPGKQWYRVTDTSSWAEGPDQVALPGNEAFIAGAGPTSKCTGGCARQSADISIFSGLASGSAPTISKRLNVSPSAVTSTVKPESWSALGSPPRRQR